MSETQRSKIGLVRGIAVAIGFSISGTLFVSPIVATSLIGPAVIPVLIFVIVAISLSLPVYVTLVNMWPVSPGHYYYISRMLIPENKRASQFIAWISSWSFFAIAGFFIIQYLVVGSADFLHSFFPAIPTSVFVAILVTISFIPVWFGLDIVGWIELILAILLVLAIGIFSIIGFTHVTIENFTPVLPTGFNNVLPAAAVIYSSLLGGLYMVDIGGELEDPETNTQKALLAAIFVEAVIILAVLLVIVGVVSYTELEGKTLAFVAQQFLTGPLLIIIGLGSVIATITSTMVFAPLIIRHVVAATTDGILPNIVASENQYGEAKIPLLLVYIFSVVTIPIDLPLAAIAGAFALTLSSFIILVLLVGVRLPSTFPSVFKQERVKSKWFLHPRVVRWSSLIAVIMTGSAFINTAISSPKGAMWYGLFVLSAIFIYLARWWQNSDEETPFLKEMDTGPISSDKTR